ncbi:type II toxin-antitoxin system RelE/ParE family toxin [Candidatus Acetothermia bacterium]|nr:type II toxin-antitoxin system RelE/ParE family toxin [Candidatus Acetothermia bacterium]
MIDEGKRIPAAFFRTRTGREPVREWLQSLNKEERRLIGADIKTVEYGWPIGMPLCRSIGNGVWEVRCNLSGNRIARVLFCTHEEKLVLLHGFIKKSRTLPKIDLNLTYERKSQLEEG